MGALLLHLEEERTVTGSAAPEKIEAADWSNLPIDLLNTVAEKVVTNVADYIRFRAVSKAWRSAHAAPRPGSQLPWLILEWQYGKRCLSFFSVADSRTYTVPLPPTLENAKSKCFCSSCNGWLVLEDSGALTISLLNPLTGALIQLPASSDLFSSKRRENMILYDRGVKKKYSAGALMVPAIAMSSDPASGQDCTVVIVSVSNWGLVSTRIGDDEWKLVDKATRYHDVIHRKGRFYAVDYLCGVAMFDSGLNKVAVVPRPTLYEDVPVLDDAYMHPPKHATRRFCVFKLKLEGGEMSLMKVDDLGDNLLFYGFSNALSYPAAECPGGKPNAIYSVEEYMTSDSDRNLISYVEPGIYDMARCAIVGPLQDGTQVHRRSACISTWFTPTP